MSDGKPDLVPWYKFLDEKWEVREDDDFPTKRKELAEQWKGMSKEEKQPYIDAAAQDGTTELIVSTTLDPNESVFTNELAVFRTHFSDDDLEEPFSWWDNLRTLLLYQNYAPFYDTDWSDHSIPTYEDREILKDVTPETFAEKVIIARNDFFNMAFTVDNKPDVRAMTLILADEEASKTGMLRVICTDEGDGKTVLDDYRVPVSWIRDYFIKLIGLGHSVERYCIDCGLDDQEEDYLKRYWIDLRGPVKDVFRKQIEMDNSGLEDGVDLDAVVKEAVEEIDRLLEAQELMDEAGP